MDSIEDVLIDDEASGAGAWSEDQHGPGPELPTFLPDQGVCVCTGVQKRPFYELCAPLIKVSLACTRSGPPAGPRPSQVVRLRSCFACKADEPGGVLCDSYPHITSYSIVCSNTAAGSRQEAALHGAQQQCKSQQHAVALHSLPSDLCYSSTCICSSNQCQRHASHS